MMDLHNRYSATTTGPNEISLNEFAMLYLNLA